MKKYYCKDCGNQIWRGSKRCQNCHNKSLIGKGNPAYKGIIYRCIDCNKVINGYKAKRCQICYHIYIKESGILKNRVKSESWRKKISSTMLKNGTTKNKNNPMYGKIAHGKGARYKQAWMRSSWETAFAKYCIKNHIKYRYEPKSFEIVYKYKGIKKEGTYRPDFYLPETDEYIEIKGYWRDDAKVKFNAFKRQYSKIKIKIVNKKL